MKVYDLSLKSLTPMLYSRPYEHEVAKEPRETHEAYEKRTWSFKAHANSDGLIVIPAIFLRNALRETAQYLGEQIPGKGKSTFTKHFNSGIGVYDDAVLKIKREDLKPLAMFVPADGKHGGGRRVWKFFPKIDKWSASFRVHVIDEIITEDILERHAQNAGLYKGFGSRRPANGGEFGRFELVSIKAVSE